MADISLKNGAGSAVTYGGVTQLKVPAADGGEDVVFQLPPVMQEKAVTITANGTTSVVPDEGKDGLSKVDVRAAVRRTMRSSARCTRWGRKQLRPLRVGRLANILRQPLRSQKR